MEKKKWNWVEAKSKAQWKLSYSRVLICPTLEGKAISDLYSGFKLWQIWFSLSFRG
jgi:hypothetical protein